MNVTRTSFFSLSLSISHSHTHYHFLSSLCNIEIVLQFNDFPNARVECVLSSKVAIAVRSLNLPRCIYIVKWLSLLSQRNQSKLRTYSETHF